MERVTFAQSSLAVPDIHSAPKLINYLIKNSIPLSHSKGSLFEIYIISQLSRLKRTKPYHNGTVIRHSNELIRNSKNPIKNFLFLLFSLHFLHLLILLFLLLKVLNTDYVPRVL